jgi:PAS domain S-box-containing protein
MPIPLRVLIIEDSEPDARLVVRTLRQADYEPTWERVETPEAMRTALERQPWDVILSDYKMPHFSGLAALRLLQEMEIDLPFIIVSGTIGEETAVEAMRAGAHDYLLKGNLTRLAPAIAREMCEAESRRARRQAEADLQTVNRGLRVLSSVNQALLRTTSEQELLQQVCDVVVVEGGYRLVWIGQAQDDPAQTVCPICSAGHEDGYLSTLHISWADNARGRGPTGTAIRTGQPAFTRDIAAAPEYAPWREEALKRGLRSSISLPLILDDRVIGALSLYGEQPDAFPPDEVKLLAELADNLAYGINTLRTRKERDVSVRRLQKEAQRAVTLLELYAKAPELTEDELYHFALDQAVALTDSTIGFLHRISDDQQTILLTAWNREALQTCTTPHETHYPVEQAGNWVDCLRLKRPIVYNDYPTSPHQKGMPTGHSPVRRFMSIPVMEGDKVRIIFGVGNKADPYEDQDVVQLQLVANELQKILTQHQAEAALQESEAKYRSLFTVEPDALLLIDAHTLQVLDANEAAVRLYGYAYAHLLTMKATDLSAEPDQTAAIIQETATDQMINVPLRYNRKADGTVFPIEATARSFVLGDHPVMFAAIRDISDRLRAEEESKRERAYLATAIDLLPFPIIFINQERQVFRANRASELIFPTRDRAQRFNVPLLWPETHVEIPLDQRPAARALRGEVVTAFEGIITASDQELPVLIYAAPIAVGSDLVAAVIAIQEITALKEADRAKNQFLNVISHEMRTPLTAILGWAQLAEDDPTLCADALHAIHQSAQAQHGVLERLILLSRILTGKLTLQRQSADLWALTDQVATATQLRAQERQVTLQCNPPAEPLPVLVDPQLMQQAIGEMLDNALKYTAVGGQVTVSATRLGEQAVVAVHDTGQGIALEDLPKLWKPFQQVVREERLGGLGIGLVLLRGIVEAHGGQVFIVSPGLGEGSTFSISIALVLPLPGPPDTGAQGDCG